MEIMYPWPRFWVPHDGSIDLSDGGFLRDPADWPTTRRALHPLAALQHWRSLVLLGEPGIGKSTTLKEEAERVARLDAAASLDSIYVDLRAFSSESLLYRRVFESEKFTAWRTGSSHLFLHFDSLDEALLRIDSIANLFASELADLPTDRLSVRIACRTAVWPAATLGVALKDIWGGGSGIFELAPLRRRDVVAAHDVTAIAVEDFMRALFAAQAVPFAVKPLTLKMLVTIYQQRATSDFTGKGASHSAKRATKAGATQGAVENSTLANACVSPDALRRRPFWATALRSGPGRRLTVRAKTFRYH
jgi:hypothetical protein